MTDLVDRLRSLAEFAARGGAPPELLKAVLPALLELLLDDIANRRLRSLQAAARTRQLAERLQAGGFTGAALLGAVCARLGISRATYYRRKKSHAGETGLGIASRHR